jgi:integrase
MPRPRARSLFELGGQWIAQEPGRAGLYRFWNDPATGRTRRASLGTTDIGLAKLALAEIIVQGAPKTVDSPLTLVLENYFVEHSDFIRTKGMARHAGKLILQKCGALIKVSQFDEAKQKEFVEWGVTEKNWSIGYIVRILGVVASACAHSKIAIDIIAQEGTILAKWPKLTPKPKRQVYEPTDEELARFFAAKIPENLRRWALNSMATAGRPEAVLQLGPTQRQREIGLIDLNLPGRRQNKKHRPAIRELTPQTKWLDQWEKQGLALFAGRYCGYASVDSVDTALVRARKSKDVNIPRLSAYSIRHRATSVLRASKNPRVPGEQISYQLGHKRFAGGEASTTRGYGQYEPDYLEEAAQALEAWITRVLKLAAQKQDIKGRKAA